MGWEECNKMDQKLLLIARLLDGEKMARYFRMLWIGLNKA